MADSRIALAGATWQRFGIVECGLIDQHRGSGLGRHRNAGYEFTAAMTGRATWLVGSEAMELGLGPQRVAVTMPATEHGGRFDQLEPCRLLWCVVDPGLHGAHALGDAHGRAELVTAMALGGNRVVGCDAATWRQAERLQALTRAATTGPLAELAAAAAWCAWICTLLQQAPHATAGAEGELAALCRRLLVAADWGALPVAELAATAGISPAHCRRRFLAETGCSPSDYIRRLRLERARELLGRGASVTAAAIACGFASSQHFATCFKRHFGRPPSAWLSR